jgi:hypothetical protein
MDLFNDIQELTKKLNHAIRTLATYGKELAESERNYKISLRQEALKLKSEKGMAVTLIDKVVYGIPEVADKRYKRDVAEAMYNTNQEYINTIKLQIRIIESQLQREWGSNK